MPARHVIDLPQASIEVEARSGYLFVIETGQLRSRGELDRYTREMEMLIGRTGLNKAIIDARGEVGEPAVDVREAMWEWLVSSERGFEMVAFVLPSEMAVARVNMTALSRRATVRAFESVQQAQRWLMRGTRPTLSASDLPSGGRSSSARPRADSDQDALAPTERPAPSDAPAARVPSAAPVPRDVAPRRSSDRGFRRPTPGGSEVVGGAGSKLRAPSERSHRESEMRSRGKSADEDDDGSQVA